MPGDLKKKIF